MTPPKNVRMMGRMVNDSEMRALADQVWDELSTRKEGFHYGEVAMNLEYMIGWPACDIADRLDDMDNNLYAYENRCAEGM